MSIELDCPLCYEQWKVRNDQVNRRTHCPKCDEEYYVPEKFGSGFREDDEDGPAPRGLSTGAMIGIGAGVGGFLLLAGVGLAIVLSQRVPTTTVPPAGRPQVASNTQPAPRPAPFAPNPAPVRPRPAFPADANEPGRTAFHRIIFTATRSTFEEMLGPGTPIAAAEMRTSLATDGCEGFCPPAKADKICSGPGVAFLKWKKDDKTIYAAFKSNEAAAAMVCAVYIGPDVPFNKKSEFKPNLFAMNEFR